MYLYGKNSVLEYLKANRKVRKAYLLKDNSPFLLPYLDPTIICYKTRQELDKLVNANHQGIVLEIPDYQYADIRELEDCQFLVLLDHLEDTHNLGAIIRTCEAAGVDGVIIPKDRSVSVTDTVYKTSVGTVERVKVFRVTNLVQTMKELQKKGFWFYGTDMHGTSYKELDYTGKIGIVIGNEGKGMSRLLTEHCDFLAMIPMKGSVNSLNASVAAGIIIFEASTKRK